jgi:hypothetical protein
VGAKEAISIDGRHFVRGAAEPAAITVRSLWLDGACASFGDDYAYPATVWPLIDVDSPDLGIPGPLHPSE